MELLPISFGLCLPEKKKKKVTMSILNSDNLKTSDLADKSIKTLQI